MLRQQALAALMLDTVPAKVAAVLALDPAGPVVPDQRLVPSAPLPGRPALPVLVPPAEVPRRSLHTAEGRAALLHAIAHIEFNAIDLALDIVWRFPDLPEDFYRDWLRIAREEAQHFTLVDDHLRTLGYAYGDFAAHRGLWDMAEKTADDVLARLALVPRAMEARGLDVNRGHPRQAGAGRGGRCRPDPGCHPAGRDRPCGGGQPLVSPRLPRAGPGAPGGGG